MMKKALVVYAFLGSFVVLSLSPPLTSNFLHAIHSLCPWLDEIRRVHRIQQSKTFETYGLSWNNFCVSLKHSFKLIRSDLETLYLIVASLARKFGPFILDVFVLNIHWILWYLLHICKAYMKHFINAPCQMLCTLLSISRTMIEAFDLLFIYSFAFVKK